MLGGDICGETPSDYSDAPYDDNQKFNNSINRFLINCFYRQVAPRRKFTKQKGVEKGCWSQLQRFYRKRQLRGRKNGPAENQQARAV